jgi:bifunctional non-homologous end joining protein LigD
VSALANLDKVLFPAVGFTKADLVGYYRAVAPAILPQLSDRATTLVRFPDGVNGPGWFQVNCRGRPDWLPVCTVRGQRGQSLSYGIFDRVDALVWAAGIGTIELHPFLWRTATPERPEIILFDLDPIAPAGLVACARVALLVRDRLAGRSPAVKTSGRKGLHVSIPAGGVDFAGAKALARQVGDELAAAAPHLVASAAARADRTGRVRIDWVQNDPGRSTIAAWSLRALPRPGVSMPVSWDEVEAAARSGRDEHLIFTPGDALRRLEGTQSR